MLVRPLPLLFNRLLAWAGNSRSARGWVSAGMEAKAGAVLGGLGFRKEDWARRTEEFSGGWQMRIALAKLLLEKPNLLLLDEPTNHLDLEARNWLEQYLTSYPFGYVLISHDRYFLDTTVNRTVEVWNKKVWFYSGNYEKYLAQKAERKAQLEAAYKNQHDRVEALEAFINRFRATATKAKQVQSRIKELEKIERIEIPPDEQTIHFSFPQPKPSGRIVAEFKDVAKSYGEKLVFSGASFIIERGDRIALVGPNGVGKSTLMRMLSGEETPDAGERTLGHNVVMQYFAQDEATRMDPAPTVYETLASGSPMQMVPMIRNILGGFLFSGDDVYKHVRVLSGGERTRLAVARMLLRPSNTLLLDEPTNHLDLDSKEVLLDALVDYGGTLIFVSHDRYFVERLATKIVEVGGGTALVYPGTYKEFLWHKEHPQEPAQAQRQDGRDRQERREGRERQEGQKKPEGRTDKGRSSSVAQPFRAAQAAGAQAVTPKQSHEEKKRVDAEARKQQKAIQARRDRIASLETRIAETEAAIKELEQAMAAPGFYDDRAAAQPVLDRHQALMWQVGDLMHQWEELQSLSDRAG
jgi:ATP-binding cassette subfamily F protein 3